MKKSYFLPLALFFTLFSGLISKIHAHSVQIAYCVSCNGDLRIFVEHWHGTESLSSTTMTISLTINNVTSTSTTSPVTGIYNTTLANLPGCSTPIIVAAACPGSANMYNNWVVFDYTGITCGVPCSFTIISGNTVFTSDGCGMYPLTVNFTIPCSSSILNDVYVCDGVMTSPITVPPNTIWSNSNPGIGLPASGVGDIPSFIPVGPTNSAVISYSNSCANTTFNIFVTPSPTPAFTADTVCVGDSTHFTNTTVFTSMASWLWNFGDATTSTAQNPPDHVYAAPGNYVVTLTATDSGGCLATVTHTVVVDASAFPAFTAANVCDGFATQFNNTSVGNNTYTWDFGTGTSTLPNPSFVFPGPGTYTVELVALSSSGCTDSISQTITVDPLPVASFTYTQQCGYALVNFTSTSTAPLPATVTTTNWDFGDPASAGNNTSAMSNPTHTFTATGSYVVTLIATTNNGCSDTITQTINVLPPPVALFVADSVCPNSPMQFTNQSTNSTSYHWDFGTIATNDTSNLANPTFVYTTSGNFTVTLITNPGPCSDTSTLIVTVFSIPVVSFTAPAVCLGNSTIFTDLSTTTSGTITGWSWDFGNTAATNDTSNIQNPTYVFPGAGVYSVVLVATGSSGCVDSITQVITIDPLPVASFVYNQQCGYTLANFSSTSTVALPSTISTTSWDFGDPASAGNNTSILLNPSHTFSAIGSYTVTLIVVSSSGCSDTITQTITVVSPPVAAFSADSVCPGTPMTFTNLSTNATTYHWDFGTVATNDTSNVANPTFSYLTSGTFTVTLITNPGPCSDTSTLVVLVYPGPQVAFTAPPVCLGFPTIFTDQTVITSGNITSWSWNFGNTAATSDTSSMQNTTYTYPLAGTYNAVLICTSSNGCTNSNLVQVIVNALPVASFSSNVPCLGNASVFTDLSSAGSGVLSNWTWNFGDASANASTQNPSHTYANDSTYNVTLIVQNSNGCVDTISNPAVVAPLPVVLFSADTLAGCPMLCVNFSDLTTINTGTITGWSWDFGDGSPLDITQNPSHCYNITGSYSISLTTTSNIGCTSVLQIPNMITVHPVPVASFSAIPQHTTIVNPTISFVDLSSGSPTTWQWNFGDLTTTGDTSGLQNPFYEYTDEYGASYVVNLIVTNQFGCVDDTSLTVVVDPEFTFFIPNAFTPNGDGVNDGFFGTGLGITSYQIWIFDRWGNLIFTTTDINESWDGSVQGQGGDIVQIDTYVWKVALTDVFDKRHKFIGHVSVIK